MVSGQFVPWSDRSKSDRSIQYSDRSTKKSVCSTYKKASKIFYMRQCDLSTEERSERRWKYYFQNYLHISDSVCRFHRALRNDVRTIYIIVGAYVCRFGTTTQKNGDSMKYFWSGDDKPCGNNESDLKMICLTRYNSTSRIWRAERAYLGDRERQNRELCRYRLFQVHSAHTLISIPVFAFAAPFLPLPRPLPLPRFSLRYMDQANFVLQ